MGRKLVYLGSAAALMGMGCAALSGVNDLQEVSEAGAPSDATIPEGASGGDATVVPPSDASPDAGRGDATLADVPPAPDAVPDRAGSAETGSETGADSGTDTGIDTGVLLDAGTDSGADTGGPLCPPVQGPVMVRASSYCIGSTEVTNAQYAQFLAAKGGNTSGQPEACAWNTTYVPPTGWPSSATDAQHPVRYVDWCDAFAYCAWSGARLCGRIGGGTNDPDNKDDASASQWFGACSFNGTRTYPYGNTYVPTACNTFDYEAGAPVPVGSASGCVGGYAGLHDMSGNVEEWEDSCDPGDAGPASDLCQGRGKDWADTPGSTCTCPGADREPRDNAKYEMGIRCCGP